MTIAELEEIVLGVTGKCSHVEVVLLLNLQLTDAFEDFTIAAKILHPRDLPRSPDQKSVSPRKRIVHSHDVLELVRHACRERVVRQVIDVFLSDLWRGQLQLWFDRSVHQLPLSLEIVDVLDQNLKVNAQVAETPRAHRLGVRRGGLDNRLVLQLRYEKDVVGHVRSN